MAEYRKPIPKSQKQISADLSVPYDPTVGNPNQPNQYSEFPEFNQSGIPFNRSEQMSLKGDTYKPFTVGLEDLDQAVMYYFQNVIQPYVVQNGQRIEVPIIYGAPEKWKSVQKDGYYKDLNGAIMLPLIMFKRIYSIQVNVIDRMLCCHEHDQGLFNTPGRFRDYSVILSCEIL
jgi:hypothetical protein